MSKPLISLQNLSHKRGKFFSLSVPLLQLYPGEVLCLAGQNGSGKTTLIEVLMGIIKPQYGHLEIQGKPYQYSVPTISQTIGYVPDDDQWIIAELTAHEFLSLTVSLQEKSLRKSIWNTIEQLAETLSFTAFPYLCGGLSHGNRKKLQLIAALASDPAILIIDELRNGLDPLAMKAAETIVHRAAENGSAVIISSHDLLWSQQFATHVMILEQGTVRLSAPIQRVLESWPDLEQAYFDIQEPFYA